MSELPAYESARDKAAKRIRLAGGMIHTSEALRAGIHSRTLRHLCEDGILEQVSRGIYRIQDQPPISNPDLVTVALRIPQSVICLISALSFHELTTQIPHAVSIALKQGAEPPRLDYPPLSVHRFSVASLSSGIEDHLIDGVKVRIYSPEKTLADCFKFRNKIGMDVVLEALKFYRSRRKFKVDALLEFAKICRVEKAMKPYLEILL